MPNRTSVDLSKLSDSELTKLAWHKNDWFVRTSRRILQERAANNKLDLASVSDELDKLLQSDDETRVLRALWLGHAINAWDTPKLQSFLNHPSVFVKSWAIQLLCETGKIDDSTLSQFIALANNKSIDPVVRLYLASALSRLKNDSVWGIAQALSMHPQDANDRNIPLVTWYGLEPLVTQNPSRAIELAKSSQIPLLTEYIIRRCAADEKGLESLMAQVRIWTPEQQRSALEQISRSMEGRVNVPQPSSWKDAYETFAKSESEEVRELALRLAVAFGDQRAFPQLRELLANPKRPSAERLRALDILVKGRDKELAPTLYQVLDNEELQSPAIRALASVADNQTPERLLGIYSKLTKPAREDAIAAMASRAPFAQKLLDAIEADKIARSDVHAFHVRQMVNLGDAPLLERINKSWGKVGTSNEEQKAAIEKYKGLLTKAFLAKADTSHGRTLFNKHCLACHQLFGAGEKVGPDLTGSNRADLNYILENLVAPNAVVGKDYQMTLLQLDDGRVLSGLITKETDSAVTLKTINDLVVVPKDEIDQRKLSELSLMPNGLLDPMPPEEIRDLVAYLASPSQVPLRGPKPNFDSKGNVPNALEGESMKVLSKSRGTTQRQDMRAFPKDNWSGNDHLWWTGAQPKDTLELEFEVPAEGAYNIATVLSKARDYAIVQIAIDGQPLGEPIDCFNNPDVITTGVVNLPTRKLTQGAHTLEIQILGKNPEAVPGFMVGFDFLLLTPTSDN